MILQVSSLAPFKKTAKNGGFSLYYGTLWYSQTLKKFKEYLQKSKEKRRTLSHFCRTKKAGEINSCLLFLSNFIIGQFEKIFLHFSFGDMGINIHRGRDLSMAEQLLRFFHIYPCLIQNGCILMTDSVAVYIDVLPLTV